MRRHSLPAVMLGTAIAIAAPGLAAATSMDDVRRLTNELGVSNVVPSTGTGQPPAEPPATTESRGISPEVTSRLTGSGATSGNPVAVRRTEVLGLLQSARAASAQGNEDECLAQLGKAQRVMSGRQP